MTKERKDYIMSQIKFNKIKNSNKSLVYNLSDDLLEDFFQIYSLDTTSNRRFINSYYQSLFGISSEFIDDEKLYYKFIDINKKYYLKLMKDFIEIRPSYIYGQESCNRIYRDSKMYDDILKYVQNFFMNFLSEENKIVYQFMINSDYSELSKYYSCKYDTVNIKLWENSMIKIQEELKLVDMIYIIHNSPVSLYHQYNKFKREYSRYLKESGLSELYKNIEKEKLKKVSSKDAIKIISQFIENDQGINSIVRYYEKYFPDRKHSIDVEIIKEFDPDLYIRYSKKVESNTKVQYAILNSTGRKLKNAIIESQYKLSLLDFLRIYNPKTLSGLQHYYRNVVNKLEPDVSKTLFSYLRKLSYISIDIEDIRNSKVIISSREITLEEKELIVQYIKDNELPYMNRVYNDICREFVKGKIDLAKPFKEKGEE